jgi:carboxymethylenebutenolidase
MTQEQPPRPTESENWVSTPSVNRRAAIAGTAAAMGYALSAQPISATAITTGTEGLDAGMVSFATGGIQMAAYRARPAGKAPAPVILVVQEVFGLHEWVKDMCRRYAKAGYYAIAPDLYARQGDATKVSDFNRLFADIVSKVPDAQVMTDLDAAAKFAASEGGDAVKLGITGYCWGGRVTWLYAAHNPALKAGVACYGRLAGQPNPLQRDYPVGIAAALKAPVLGLYGALDKGIPQTDVGAMKAALRATKSRSSITVFAGADHGFFADYRPSYNPAAAKAGWAQGLAWFKRYL